MSEEPIQKDDSSQVAEAQESQAPVENEKPNVFAGQDPVSRREQKLREAAERRIEQREADRRSMFAINNPDSDLSEYDQAKAAAAADADLDEDEIEEQELEAQAAANKEKPEKVDPTGWQTDEDGGRFRILMVNGQERRISEEEYDRLAQKELAGDAKLRQAAEQARALQEQEARLAQREALLQQQAQREQQEREDTKALIAEHQEALLSGDTEKSAEILEKVLTQGRRDPTPDMSQLVDAVSTQVESRAAQREHQASVDEGFDAIQRDYSEVLNDPYGRAIADQHIKKLREKYPHKPPKEILIESGEFASKLLGLGGASTNSAPNNGEDIPLRTERKERKGRLKPMPNAANRGPKPPDKQVPDMSPAAKIARMRARRFIA